LSQRKTCTASLSNNDQDRFHKHSTIDVVKVRIVTIVRCVIENVRSWNKIAFQSKTDHLRMCTYLLSYDLDLDLEVLTFYLRNKNDFYRSMLSKVRGRTWHTHKQADLDQTRYQPVFGADSNNDNMYRVEFEKVKLTPPYQRQMSRLTSRQKARQWSKLTTCFGGCFHLRVRQQAETEK